MAIKDWVTCEVEGCTLPIVGANNQGAGQGWRPKTFSVSAHGAMMISEPFQLTKRQIRLPAEGSWAGLEDFPRRYDRRTGTHPAGSSGGTDARRRGGSE
jgi:hypothetical protein